METLPKYRYSAFGARGEVCLHPEKVRWKSRTYLGFWEQEIPYEVLNPSFGKLKTTSSLQLTGLVLGLFLVSFAIVALVKTPTSFWTWSFLGVFGLTILILTLRSWSTEFIVFHSRTGGIGLSYTRKGPDSSNCDQFTKLIQESIIKSQEENAG